MISQGMLSALNKVKDLRHYKKQALILAVSFAMGTLPAALNFASNENNMVREFLWNMPDTTPLQLTSDLNTMLSKPLFGGDPIEIQPPSPPIVADKSETNKWQLVGIVTQGDQWLIVIKNEAAEKLEFASTGDMLPSGEQLSLISHNHIEVLGDEGYRQVSLFQNIDRARTE